MWGLEAAIGDDALREAFGKGLDTDPYYYQFELQWPDLYTAIKFSDVTKEQFEKYEKLNIQFPLAETPETTKQEIEELTGYLK